MSNAEVRGEPVPTGDGLPPVFPVRRSHRIAHRLLAVPTPLIFLVSVGLAVLLLWWQGTLDEVGPVARAADWTTIAEAFLLYLAGQVLLCVRWQRLIQIAHGATDLARAAEAFLTSVVVNYAAPIGLAVPTRAALTKRAFGLNASQTAAVALWEVGCDVIVLGLASLVWLVGTGAGSDAIGRASDVSMLWFVLAVAVILTLAIVAHAAFRRWPHHGRRLGRGATDLLMYPRQEPGAAALILVITIGYWVVQAVVLRLLLDATGAGTGPGLVLGLVSIPILIGMISPVPGGAGVREALMLAVARIHHANGAAVLLAALTYRVALFAAVPLLYGLVRVWQLTRREPA